MMNARPLEDPLGSGSLGKADRMYGSSKALGKPFRWLGYRDDELLLYIR